MYLLSQWFKFKVFLKIFFKYQSISWYEVISIFCFRWLTGAAWTRWPRPTWRWCSGPTWPGRPIRAYRCPASAPSTPSQITCYQNRTPYSSSEQTADFCNIPIPKPQCSGIPKKKCQYLVWFALIVSETKIEVILQMNAWYVLEALFLRSAFQRMVQAKVTKDL